MDKKYIEPDNLYYQIRTAKGLSRDKASNIFERISSDRLERIENGKVLPNPEEIMELAEKYEEPRIRNYYCSHQCPMGKKYVDEIKKLDLSQAVLQILAGMNKISEYKEKIIDIAAQERITKDNKEDLEKIKLQFKKMKADIESFLLWVEKEQ